MSLGVVQREIKGKAPVNSHDAYHAHVYFDESTSQVAKELCDETANKFAFQVGRFHERLVGPHPCWSCQIIFTKEDFDEFIPWLDKNRQGLTIFVHGLTGDDLKDHTDFAYWLGEEKSLNLQMFM